MICETSALSLSNVFCAFDFLRAIFENGKKKENKEIVMYNKVISKTKQRLGVCEMHGKQRISFKYRDILTLG